MATTHDYKALNAGVTEQVATIRGNLNYSDEGRQKLIAQVYSKAHARAQEWRTAEAAASAKSRTAAESRLFGLGWKDRDNPSAIISMRDAIDRAAKITSETEAAALLHRAVITGDEVLQKALLGRAFEVGMVAVVDKYVESHPNDVADIDELIGLNAHDDTASTAAGKLAQQMATSIQQPPELRNLGIDKIERLGAEAGEVVEVAPKPTFDAQVFGGGSPSWARVVGDVGDAE